MSSSSSDEGEVKAPTTLVTAYFTLPSRKKSETNGPSYYMQKGAALCAVPWPMVIFVDRASYKALWDLRRKAGHLDKTVFVVKKLEDLVLYQYKSLVDTARNVYWPTKDPRSSSDVHVLMGSKYEFVQEVIDWNPFGSTAFAWIDLAFAQTGARAGKFKAENLIAILKSSSLPTTCSVQIMNDVNDDTLKDLNAYFSTYRFSVCGNFVVFGSAANGLLVCKAVMDKWVEHTKLGYGHGDELTLRHVLAEHPDWFHVRFGDYNQQLSNFWTITDNANFLFQLLYQVLLKQGSSRSTWLQSLFMQLVSPDSGLSPGLLRSPAAFKQPLSSAVQVVVSHYKEDVAAWLPKLECRSKIYHKHDKSIDATLSIPMAEHGQLENVGREAHTMLHHITTQWDALAPITMFLQGDHPVHDELFATTEAENIWNAIKSEKPWFPATGGCDNGDLDGIGWFCEYKEMVDSGQMYMCKFGTMRTWWSILYQTPFPSEVARFTPCGLFSAAAQQIKRIPRWFYKRLQVGLSEHKNPEEGHFMERSWWTLMNIAPERLFRSTGGKPKPTVGVFGSALPSWSAELFDLVRWELMDTKSPTWQWLKPPYRVYTDESGGLQFDLVVVTQEAAAYWVKSWGVPETPSRSSFCWSSASQDELRAKFDLPRPKRKAALLLTGEVRTFDQTHATILKNIIEPNDCDIFIHYESQRYKEELKFDANTFWEVWPGRVVAAKHISSAEKQEYEKLRDQSLRSQPALQPKVLQRSGVSVGYLKQSGTMIELYQVERVFAMMEEHEQARGQKYDFVIRSRLDAILLQPWPLASLSRLPSDLSSLDELLLTGNHPSVRKVNHNDNSSGSLTKRVLEQKDVAKAAELWKELVSKNLYSWRKNVIYGGARPAMASVMPNLFAKYGAFDDGAQYTWDSESQFDQLCRSCSIWHIDHFTDTDETYLSTRALNLAILKDAKVAPDLPKDLAFAVIRPASYRQFAH